MKLLAGANQYQLVEPEISMSLIEHSSDSVKYVHLYHDLVELQWPPTSIMSTYLVFLFSFNIENYKYSCQ